MPQNNSTPAPLFLTSVPVMYASIKQTFGVDIADNYYHECYLYDFRGRAMVGVPLHKFTTSHNHKKWQLVLHKTNQMIQELEPEV